MPAPSTRHGRDVTGDARFRKGWRGALVLQVRVRIERDPALGGDRFRWIDADDGDLFPLRYQREHRKLEPLL